MLNAGRWVALFCGAGCAAAPDAIFCLAGRLNAPVGWSFRGKEWVEHDDPYAAGMTLGRAAADKATHE